MKNDKSISKKKAVHLRFCMYNGPAMHPQKQMESLGITYQHATPQSISDQWQFWNCENVPEKLPDYLEVADWNPMECIGWGLCLEDAELIRDYESGKE